MAGYAQVVAVPAAVVAAHRSAPVRVADFWVVLLWGFGGSCRRFEECIGYTQYHLPKNAEDANRASLAARMAFSSLDMRSSCK